MFFDIMASNCSHLLFRRCFSIFINNQYLRTCITAKSMKLYPKCLLKSSKLTLSSMSSLNQKEPIEQQNVEYLNSEEIDDFEPIEHSPDVIDFNKIVDGDFEKIKQLKMLQLKIDLWRQQGESIPQRLSETDWIDLLSCQSMSAVKSLLNYYYRKEKEKEIARDLKEKKHMKYLEWKAIKDAQEPIKITTTGPIIYNLVNNTIFYRIREQTMDRLWNYKLVQASLLAPTVLIDCTYDEYMSTKDLLLLSKQITQMWSSNRDHFQPLNLLFCGLNPENSLLFKRLKKYLPVHKPEYPFFHTTKKYTELYSKKELVYLSPHAPDYLTNFDHNAVYVLGAFIDITQDLPLSRTKAKRDGIRMAKLPVEDMIRIYNAGHKSLSLPIVTNILNDLRITNNWKIAMRHILDEKRRISDEDDSSIEDDSTRKKLSAMTISDIQEQVRRKHIYEILLDRSTTKKSTS